MHTVHIYFLMSMLMKAFELLISISPLVWSASSEAAVTHKGARPRKDAAPITPFTCNDARPPVVVQGQRWSRVLLTARPRSDVVFTFFSVPADRRIYN